MLLIDRESNGSVSLRLAGGTGPESEAHITKASAALLRTAGKALGEIEPIDGTKLRTQRIREFADRALPKEIQLRLRQWAVGSQSLILCIRCQENELAALPWEVLPEALGLPQILVTRLTKRDFPVEPVPLTESWPKSVLVVGWSKVEDYAQQLPGIDREMQGMATSFGSRIEVAILSEPTLDQLELAARSAKPDILHLCLAGVREVDGEATLWIPDGSGSLKMVPASKLVELLLPLARPHLVVVNACNVGPNVARVFSEELGTTAFGWASSVDDQQAADFSLYFYERLLEGASPLNAVNAFVGRASLNTKDAFPPIPMLWHPTADSVYSWGVKVPAPSVPAPPSSAAGLAPEVTVKDFQPVTALNPALLKNGRSALKLLTLSCNQEVRNLRLEICCDTGSACSVVRSTMTLSPGTNPVQTEGVEFPVLYQLISDKAGRRYVNFVVTASVGEAIVAETTRSVLWMGAQEWMDQPETWAFIPAFVQCESKGVREILDEAGRTLRTVGSPADDFDGYLRGGEDPLVVDRQMKAIFQTLRDGPYMLSYISPPSSPLFVPGSASSVGQRVRFPDEIIEHKRGTCHDLALLFASLAEHVGIYPLVVLIPGHTFFGYWTGPDKHDGFWSNRSTMIRASSSDASWTIDHIAELQALLKEGSVVFVEATEVTKREATFEASCEKGGFYIADREQKDFDTAIDVWASRRAVQPV